MKYLFIAEKPSVMDAVADTYKRHRQDIISKIGEIDFVALSGHVCRYLEPDEYPQWKGLKWAETVLPMIPDPFIITSIDEPAWKKKFYLKVKNAVASTSYDGIIVATDSDVEGNGIYYLLCENLKLKNYQTLRFFEQSLTDKEILDSLYSMTDFYRNPRDIRMTEAYLVRSHADWLIGMNGSRALTVKTGEKRRVGRVKAPTLKLVYDNSKAIDEFIPHSDYLAEAGYLEGFSGIYYDKDSPVLFATKQEAEQFAQSLNLAGNAPITKIEKKTIKTEPPRLYKLSTIQKDADAQYHYDPQKTQDIIQSLYEKHKLVSYPRTNGEYVSSQKALAFKALLSAAGHVPALTAAVNHITPGDITRVQKNPHVVNDKEVQKESHDALLPTDKIPDLSKLTQDEINIYEMISKRLVAQFLPDLAEEKTTLYADIDGYMFKSTGTAIADKGWTVLYNRQSKGEIIPETLSQGDILSVLEMGAHEKKSTPPKRLTTGTLIEAMEKISKYINDKNLKQTMNAAKGIGQPSTRATIIEDLIQSGYMDKKGKANQLFISEQGKRYIEAIQTFTISDPVQTAEWESVFQGVREGTVSYPDAENQFICYIKDFVKEVDALKIQKPAGNAHIYSKHKCPYCKKDILVFKWGYACEDSRTGCNFKVSSFDGKLSESDLDTLLTTGVTRKIKNISKSTKTGNSFDAKVKLNPKGNQYATGFVFN